MAQNLNINARASQARPKEGILQKVLRFFAAPAPAQRSIFLKTKDSFGPTPYGVKATRNFEVVASGQSKTSERNLPPDTQIVAFLDQIRLLAKP